MIMEWLVAAFMLCGLIIVGSLTAAVAVMGYYIVIFLLDDLKDHR